MRSLAFAAVLVLPCLPGAARAEKVPPSVCASAYTSAQRLRDDGKLIEARAALRICAQPSCKDFIVKDCTAWLDAVEKSLPTVVISAKDAAGADLVDVTVSVDGAPFLSKLDGQSTPMNPGAHVLHLELPDGTATDTPVLIKEGERNRDVTIVLKRTADANRTSTSPGQGNDAGQVSETAGSASGWKTAGWVVGGIGAAGLAAGAVFGLLALGEKNSGHCDSNNACVDMNAVGRSQTDAAVSDIGFAGGGALFAAGLALVLFSPGGTQDNVAAIRLAPAVGANRLGLALVGSW